MRYQCKTQTGKVLFEIVAENLYPALQAAEVCSESQLYKQAGNSIVVDVLEAIFDTMLTETKTTQQMKLGDW